MPATRSQTRHTLGPAACGAGLGVCRRAPLGASPSTTSLTLRDAPFLRAAGRAGPACDSPTGLFEGAEKRRSICDGPPVSDGPAAAVGVAPGEAPDLRDLDLNHRPARLFASRFGLSPLSAIPHESKASPPDRLSGRAGGPEYRRQPRRPAARGTRLQIEAARATPWPRPPRGRCSGDGHVLAA
jgi:hypothetical protein